MLFIYLPISPIKVSTHKQRFSHAWVLLEVLDFNSQNPRLLAASARPSGSRSPKSTERSEMAPKRKGRAERVRHFRSLVCQYCFQYFRRELHSNRGLSERRAVEASWAAGPMAEVEETLKRIQAHKGVIGTIIVNAEGIPIRTTLDNSTTVQYAGLLHQLTMKAKSTVRDIDPQNDLTFLRIRSKKHEIMVAPDKEYLLIVIQNPCE
uniref:Roadblock/LAMTOR2 domain-containing protein n=2 Tax=Anolis carolinensis TaxID=28377 RepID=H9GEB0_ANOCA